MALTPGTRLGPYHVVNQLGEGGMGEVYLAQDTRLRRRVALKVLPAARADDDRARQRLLIEAQAAAGLDHPNICTVYDAGEAGGHLYIAMQYIEGETIAARLRRRPVEPAAAAAIGVSLARALAEAHARGIIHRDVKPQNIMLSTSGQVKVLDFGLAKATAPRAGDEETATILTQPGMVAGTERYMSPEQARGEPLDERSDVFSAGIVLYEVVSGRYPFDAPSAAETMSRLLLREPPPLDQTVSSDLRRIIAKCLEKDRNHRYQTARDLAVDLEALTRTPSSPGVREVSGRVRRPTRALVAGVVIGAAALTAWLMTRDAAAPADAARFEQITAFADAASGPVLSPDGKMVAFFRDANPFLNRADIYVKLLPGGDAIRVAADPRPKYGLAFSPDGSRLTYTVIGEGDDLWSTWTVPVLGGHPPARLLPNASGLTWIGDRRVLFSEIRDGGLHMGLVTATETRQDRRVIYFPEHVRAMAHYSALSPDSQWVLTVEMNKTGGWERCRLLPFDGRSSGDLIGPAGQCRSAAWSPDGAWMYFAVETGGVSHLWRQRFPAGRPEPLTTNPATDERGIAVAPDGRSIVTSVGRLGSSIWRHDGREDRLITPEGFASRPRLSADGTRAYYLLRRDAASAAQTLARVDLASGRMQTLLPDVAMTQYHVSSDDRDVVFTTGEAGGAPQVWIASLDLREPPRRLAENADSAYFGADRDVLFRALEGHSNFLDRIAPDGTGRARLLDTAIFDLTGVSPDGRWAIVDSGVVELATRTMKALCATRCPIAWSPDRRSMSISLLGPQASGVSAIVPLAAGQLFPAFPADGAAAFPVWSALPGARIVDRADVIPESEGTGYVFTRTDEFRNLYRIPVR